MRALLDTDILLDVALKREPFFQASADVLRWAETEPGQCSLAWHSLSNIAYLVKPSPRKFLAHLLEFMEIADVGTREARLALSFQMADLEDAFQAASALAFDAYFIVTRNIVHYRKSPIPAIAPDEFLREVGK